MNLAEKEGTLEVATEGTVLIVVTFGTVLVVGTVSLLDSVIVSFRSYQLPVLAVNCAGVSLRCVIC